MPATFGDVYERLSARYPDPRERGREFEPLVADVLRTDRMFRGRFNNVWRWSDWPDRRSGDIGVDIVAERQDGGLTAIQCKCYDPQATLYESDVSTFLANTNAEFSERLIVSTTSNWSSNLLALIANQQPPVQRRDFFGLEETTIDWDAFLEDETAPLVVRPRKEVRPHQQAALDDVFKGLKDHDRGKLIMACGTGKTFTSLRAAEEIAGPGGRVLFAAPSISLVAQALREWNADARTPIRAFAVCSDPKVGRGDSDGARVYDLPIPATTDPARLAEATAAGAPDRLTVVFTTYQSMSVIRDAQAAGMPEFDLVVCDEAHRTTGATLSGEERSNFLLVHDTEAIRARKRLYMTATPRVYAATAKKKAQEADAYVASMDDEHTYGPELHRLGFAESVEAELLSDYKVAILVIREDEIARELQQELKGHAADLELGDAGRVIGCLNGLAKLDPERREFQDDPAPMSRAVAFSNTIKASKHFVDLVERMQGDASLTQRRIRAEARHVDGKSGVLERARQLVWLGGETMVMEQQCHILSNARCLTEGIDVPSLDAVLFLQPRKSQIDVVQAVGRVMRRAEGKKYGYIILPVVVPAGTDPATALDRSSTYNHVWEVLQALRSHDERFNAWVNQLDLNKSDKGPVCVIGVGSPHGDEDDDDDEPLRVQLDFEGLEEWRDAIYAKIVLRCGERRYWEQWAESVADIARTHRERIRALIETPGPAKKRFGIFVRALRRNLNDSISEDDAAGMLSQHLITKPVFDALFGSSRFAELNPVSQAMQRMIGVLERQGLEAETKELADFYASVRRRAEGIDNAEGRQRIAIELYDNFFRKAFPREAERLGIVYTPVEIVDFIIRAVSDLLQSEFGASLSDEGVHLLDPFTGTGTFVARLIQSGLIAPDDLPRKYRSEIHANDIMLLAYYIAAVNIENSFHEAISDAGSEPHYEPFGGIVLTDTFQASEPGDRREQAMFPRNDERIERQLALDIRVILGNPPWSVGQRSANDENQNLAYPALDGNKGGAHPDVASIASTYSAAGAPGLKRALYDSHVRAVRWASNRVLQSEDGGIVAFVTNSGFLDGKAFDGFRKTLASEFHAIHVYNLRGNQRTAGEQSRREGGKLFGSGSRAGVAILLLVKRPGSARASHAQIRYRDIGDYLTRENKLGIVARSGLNDDDWGEIVPNEHGDWINQRSAHFLALRPLANTRGQPPGSDPIFRLASRGVTTSRDAWVFDSSESNLRDRIDGAVDFYNAQVDAAAHGQSKIDRDATQFSWDGTIENLLHKGVRVEVDDAGFREAVYRPFFRQQLYLDRAMNNSVYRLPRIFPTAETCTPSIVVESKLRTPGRTPGILAVDSVPEVASVAGAAGQAALVFPRYIYDSMPAARQAELVGYAGQRRDNITDATLTAYQSRYGDDVTKDHIFAYVYGILHSPDYRERYATDLAKMLPRIPDVSTADAFYAFSEAGQDLLDLHIGYEDIEPYPLDELLALGAPDAPERYRVKKMKWAGKARQPDRSRIIYNEWLTLSAIPDEAHEYVVGPRSALEWLIDRYRVKTDKPSGIVNDVNDWGLELDPPNPRYIVDLIKRIVTVSVETMQIVDNLPPLREAD